ncbi:MAG: ABC transporter permease [Candidatus Acidiferrum sp.]
MISLRQSFERLRSLFSKTQLDTDLDAEMAAHLDLAVEENLQRGMSTEEARRHALTRFGGAEQAKEQHRDARSLPLLDEFSQDLRYAFRTFRRDRAFVAIAIIILTLGIGANIAVFSVVNTILLRPLPFHDPQQLVFIAAADAKSGMSSSTYSVDGYEEFKRQNNSFQDVTGYFAFSGPNNIKLARHGDSLPVTGLQVVGNFFPTLGVQPMLGRNFSPDELQKNARPVVILTHQFWRRQFAADPAIVGQAITLDNKPVTVIGVLPPTFDFGSVFSPGLKSDLFGPAVLDGDMRDWGNTLALVGRLKLGITVAQAQAEANIIFPRLLFSAKHPEWGGGYTGRLTELKEYVTGKLRRSLIVLWSAVGLILLIVCVNLANLLLARAGARSKEFAMRRALGAGRARLIRQLLTESLLLTSAGALLGLGLAQAITSYLAHQGSLALPLLSSLTIDGRALAWTMLISLVAAVFFGLAPNLKISAGNLQEALKDSGTGMTQSKKHDRMRGILVISEVALACVLLVGAGLLLRSFLRVLDVDLGFQPSRAAAITVDYDDGGKDARRGPILQEIIGRVKAIPGIESVGITDNVPLDRNRAWNLSAKGREVRKGDLSGAFVYITTPGYLDAMGMQLRAGRDFTWADSTDSEHVVILNKSAADYFWPGEDPIGRIAIVAGKDARVVGVISDVRESSLETQAGFQMYLPSTQQGPEGAELVVRTKLPPDVLASSVMSVLRSINPGQPATEFRTIQQLVDRSVSPRRFFVLLVSLFAALGLILASLGIYGVISYSVSRQTQEIGIRMALGATASRVQLAVINKTLRLALAGIALGTFASFIVAKAIASLLFATNPNDPPTFAATILLLTLIAVVAGYIPARRASHVDPITALRVN